MESPSPIKVILAFLAIYVIWGSTYLAIAFAIETIPPFLMAGSRFIITAIILLSWLALSGAKMPSLKQWKAAAVSGIFLFVGGNVSVVWAEKYIASGVAAIIVASMPLWFVLFDKSQLLKLKTDRKLGLGLLLGFAGVIILTGIDDIIMGRLETSIVISYIILIIAPISWVLGTLYAKKENHPADIMTKVAIQSLSGGLVTMFFSLISGEMNGFSVTEVSFLSLSSLVYLIVFGTIIAYYSYAWLIQIKPSTQVGTYAYVNPIIAVILGWWLNSEELTMNVVIGLVIILAGVFLVNYSFARQRKIELAKVRVK